MLIYANVEYVFVAPGEREVQIVTRQPFLTVEEKADGNDLYLNLQFKELFGQDLNPISIKLGSASCGLILL